MKEILMRQLRNQMNPTFLQQAWPTKATPEMTPVGTGAPGMPQANPFDAQSIAKGIDMPDMSDSGALAPNPSGATEFGNRRAIMGMKLRDRLANKYGGSQNAI